MIVTAVQQEKQMTTNQRSVSIIQTVII